MSIDVEVIPGPTQVYLFKLQGKIDGTNYQEVINVAKEKYQQGARNLLLDFSEVSFLSSAGLVSLHSIGLIMRGEDTPSPEAGWDAFHAIDRSSTTLTNVKILNPQPKIANTLKISGMDQFFEVFTDREQALASFG